MQKWYQQEPETVQTTPIQSPVAPVQRHYDPDTVSRAVEIAARMQADDQINLISHEELEAIASEAGIEPRFIRQALPIAEKEQELTTKTVQPTRKRRHRMSKKTRALMLGVPFAYTLAMVPIFCMTYKDLIPTDTLVSVLTLLTVPCLLIMISAGLLKRVRQGMVTGAAVGLGMFLSSYIAAFIAKEPFGLTTRESLLAIGFFVLSGASLGLFSAAITKYFSSRTLRRHWLAEPENEP